MATPEPSAAPTPEDEQGGHSGTATPTPEPESSPEPSPSDPSGTPEPVRKPISIPWGAIFILLSLLLLLPIWYWVLRAYRTTQIRNPDGHRAAIACWRYARSVSAFGPEIPEVIVRTAEKAAFSPHMIHREELQSCREELRRMIEAVYPTLSKLQKFRFRFLRGLK